jgi:hypothetical protein
MSFWCCQLLSCTVGRPGAGNRQGEGGCLPHSALRLECCYACLVLSAVRLHEVGPRLELEIVKVRGGACCTAHCVWSAVMFVWSVSC